MENLTHVRNSRRDFLVRGSALLGAAALAGSAGILGCGPKEDKVPVLPPEKVMRDHGVLQRLLLAFEEMAGRLKYDRDVPPGVLTASLELGRSFVQDHHEKLEEELLFPHLEKVEAFASLVKVLREQHQAGRQVLGLVKGQGTPEGLGRLAGRVQVGAYLHLFARMYRPHTAREDAGLFPVLRLVTSPQEFIALGKKWQAQEEARFGKGGYEKILELVAGLEKELGIADIAQYTPKV
ncbi:MAG: hemerythrin domain-containing protein [Deltaproteobacteria bacterium]|nr:hemerythrin domain-containing protein [Deltaproteobacteria bacterium]